MFTIFGASGFVGSYLAQYLRRMGEDVQCPPRGTESSLAQSRVDLGHVIYAIGLTGDFRTRPFDTVHAHISLMADVLQHANYTSFLYLSSTRIYAGLIGPVNEQTPLCFKPAPERLYDLTKLTGEALVLAQDNPAARVARLSNVTGAGQSGATFLGQVVGELVKLGEVTIGEAPKSSKDYVDVDDVASALTAIARQGQCRMYNVASGRQTTHNEIAQALSTYGRVRFSTNGVIREFPQIANDRLVQEFDLVPKNIATSLTDMVQYQLTLKEN